MSRQKVIYNSYYNGYKISTNEAIGFGCIENIISGYCDRLKYMTSKHRQVSVMQLVVSPPSELSPQGANKLVGDCLNSIKKTMTNNGIEMQAGWVRETAEFSESPHYHIGIIVNGSKCQSAVKVRNKFKDLMNKRVPDDSLGGSAHYCKPDHQKYSQQESCSAGDTVIKIRQDKPNADLQFENALNKLSYDAKTGPQKANKLPGRIFGFTQLKQ